MLHQFLLWRDVICAQDKSLWPSPSGEITHMENKEWMVSFVLYIKRKESWRPREGCPFLCSYCIQERGYMLWQIYSKIECWVFFRPTSATDFLRIFKPVQTQEKCAFYKMVIQVKTVLKPREHYRMLVPCCLEFRHAHLTSILSKTLWHCVNKAGARRFT